MKFVRGMPPPGRFLLTPETEAALRQAGCPPSALTEIGKLKHYCDKLNRTSNVIACYLTMLENDNGTARRLRAMFCPALPAQTRAAARPTAMLYRAPSGTYARSRIDAELVEIDDI